MRYSLFFGLVLLALASSRPSVAQLYDVRPGSVVFNKTTRDALSVQVDGTPQWTRDFWQSWLKDTYNIKLKGSGVLGVGRKDVLEAKQVPMSSVSGKLLDLYSSVVAPTDSTTELSVWAALGPGVFLHPDNTTTEYAAMRTLLQTFAAAARVKAYQEQIDQAEKRLKESEKEKDDLQKDIKNKQADTKSNLARIEELRKQNINNTLQARQDSIKLLDNARVLETRKAQLQRRKDQLSALDRH